MMDNRKRSNDLGPTGKYLSANVKRLRERARLSITELSERTYEQGRPIQPLGIRRIEAADDSEGSRKPRRVDADDLVTLALALDVSPTALLLPVADTGELVELTSTTSVPFAQAWRWARAEEPLGEPEHDPNEHTVREIRFRSDTHPDTTTRDEHADGVNEQRIERMSQQLQQLSAQIQQLHEERGHGDH